MAKQLKFSKDARKALLKGIDTVAKAVVTTLGPKGRNIALDKKWGAPNIVHDGVSVAKEIDLPDPFENMGAQLVKEAASKTNDNAGDGTTTSTLLAQVITQKGMAKIDSGANPMIVKKGIEKAVEAVTLELKRMAKPIKGNDEIEGEALAALVVNKLKGTFNTLAIKAPGFGDRRKEMLEDVAILTGATVISEDTGMTFESIEVTDLGRAEKVWADKDNARIIGGKGEKKAIDSRVESIKKQIKASDSDFDKEKFEERLAKLAGGVAVINVGAATEVELNDKKERVKDAVGATKAAVEEGIVPGGETALLRAREVLKKGKVEKGDEKIGLDIVYDALSEPIQWLAKNAGDDEKAVLKKVMASKDNDFGYNALTSEFGSMTKMGIIDPVKVTRSALQNAASVAMMVLTTEGLVTDIPEPKAPPMPQGGMGGMDY